MRGQSAVEYLLIFSAVLVIFAAVTLGQMINPAQEAARNALYLSQARSAADAIAGAINSVYANGPGAVKSMSFSTDRIWGLQLTDNYLKISLKLENLSSVNVDDNIRYGFSGALQNIPSGTYTVIVEWSDSQEDLVRDGAKIYIYIKPVGG